MDRPNPAPDPALALELALTIRHDGHGGVADDLTDPTGLTDWVRRRPTSFGYGFDAAGYTADPANLGQVRQLRNAVRALFARAVRPAPPSSADASRLLPVPDALEVLNAAAGRAPAVPVLRWPEGGRPVLSPAPAGPAAPGDLLLTALATAAGVFLASPDAARLRACHAPRCVRYFLKEHPRQEWCKPACGNRARVARHHERHRPAG
ncbi:ABATE domain-containing protein [Streptomyces sp. NPDC005955]|uniref:CGNR zinc finger domain-containing protein n=1 Tax=Streptomyces sp. NPDC005955 TaxID=3364738 RepID=UPI003693CF6C